MLFLGELEDKIIRQAGQHDGCGLQKRYRRLKTKTRRNLEVDERDPPQT
jgi:hypothetical protein